MASSATTTDADHKCAVCYQPSSLRCSACRRVYYCSASCQKKDWSSHKFFCQLEYPKKDNTKDLVRAVFLPYNSETPEFVNIDHSSRNRLLVDVGPGNRAHIFPPRTISTVQRLIEVYFRDNFLNDGSLPNKCVTTITNGANKWRWRGPLIIYQIDDTVTYFKEDYSLYVDFEKQYCNEIVSFFLDEHNSDREFELIEERVSQVRQNKPFESFSNLMSMEHTRNPAENSIFMKIIRREKPATILYEDGQCIAIQDINPQAPTHFLVIPKKPLIGLSHATDEQESLLGHLLNVARKVAVQKKLSKGYRVVINDGPEGGQEVMHLHIHVLGGRQMVDMG